MKNIELNYQSNNAEVYPGRWHI